MRWSGIIVLAFIVFHLLDLTAGTAQPRLRAGRPVQQPGRQLRAAGRGRLLLVANVLLGIHLFHGAWSLFQSLGINNPRFNQWRKRFAQGFAAVIVIGNCSASRSPSPSGSSSPSRRARRRLRGARRARDVRAAASRPPRRWRRERHHARREGPRRADRGQVDPAQVRHEAGGAAQPPPLQGDRRRHRPGRRRRRRHPRRARLRRPRLHVPRLAPGGRTRSPPRAASTPPRTTRATATRSTASSTTR